jgi:2,3,4,5-tetrahydropyridine-2-carboxylate N-succinyltransferase
MRNYESEVQSLWENYKDIRYSSEEYIKAKNILKVLIDCLDKGKIRTCKKDTQGKWHINQWIKKAILLWMFLEKNKVISSGELQWYDKVLPKFNAEDWDDEKFHYHSFRVVPGAYIRKGAYIGNKVIVMPSFINIGAYVGDNSMIDSNVTIGSCVHVGKNCHISAGTVLAGVLEPLQSNPVIIEDNCFIGAQSLICEGIIVEEGVVIGAGTLISSSTKIVDRETGEIFLGRIPQNSVVVPGVLPNKDPKKPSLSCAVIVKKVDEETRSKTSINNILRNI